MLFNISNSFFFLSLTFLLISLRFNFLRQELSSLFTFSFLLLYYGDLHSNERFKHYLQSFIPPTRKLYKLCNSYLLGGLRIVFFFIYIPSKVEKTISTFINYTKSTFGILTVLHCLL